MADRTCILQSYIRLLEERIILNNREWILEVHVEKGIREKQVVAIKILEDEDSSTR